MRPSILDSLSISTVCPSRPSVCLSIQCALITEERKAEANLDLEHNSTRCLRPFEAERLNVKVTRQKIQYN